MSPRRIAAGALAAVLVAGCGDGRRAEIRQGAPGDAAPPPSLTDAGPIAPAPGRFVGVVVAAESVDVAPRFEGVIARVKVRAGDRVAAGAILAEMDPAPLQEELRAAEASLRGSVAEQHQADVDLRGAVRTLEVEVAAVAAGTSPRRAQETAEVAVARAKAAQERARSVVAEQRSRLETARARLGDTALRAPFAGVIGMRYRDAGATIAAGAPVVRVVGDGGLRVRFAVPPGELGALAPGDSLVADVETLATSFTVVVRQISPALDPASGMIIAEAELPEDPETTATLRPGMAADVRRP